MNRSPTSDSPTSDDQMAARPGEVSRRRLLSYGASGLACLTLGGTGMLYAASHVRSLGRRGPSATIFKNDAPKGGVWELWKRRGWAVEARHYLRLGQNIQCQLCPNECVLEPEDRGRCRNRVYKDGVLYTMAYGNPSSFDYDDPIEKKPLYHFLPASRVYSIATAGCGFRCLNCQQYYISQRKPEELKDPRGPSGRRNPRYLHSVPREGVDWLSMFPEDVAGLAEYFRCPSIAYTYSEPTSWYEYMIDTAKAARQIGIKNVWVTCGSIRQEPLVELCQYLDAANVDLKGFSDEVYRDLSSGRLEPILSTLRTLRQQGVWFEVTNLVVPTYTDKPDMIRRMCDWMVEELGPDCPLHFSRFRPEHKLTNLPRTPEDVLVEARSIARAAGLRYVYIANCPELDDAGITWCPNCGAAVIERQHIDGVLKKIDVREVNFDHGKCRVCGTPIAGKWSA